MVEDCKYYPIVGWYIFMYVYVGSGGSNIINSVPNRESVGRSWGTNLIKIYGASRSANWKLSEFTAVERDNFDTWELKREIFVVSNSNDFHRWKTIKKLNFLRYLPRLNIFIVLKCQ